MSILAHIKLQQGIPQSHILKAAKLIRFLTQKRGLSVLKKNHSFIQAEVGNCDVQIFRIFSAVQQMCSQFCAAFRKSQSSNYLFDNT